MTRPGDLARLLRPSHWVKGAFVLLPVPFAAAAGAAVPWAVLGAGLGGFSLLASAVYVLNDLCDAARDRHHPDKRERPLAAGRVSRRAACLLGLGSLAAATALFVLAGSARAGAIAALYLLLSTGYCVGLRHVTLLDVFLIASGYLLRVLAGCALVGVPPSPWLLVCTSTLALFLAFAKRHADLARGIEADHRPSLEGYSAPFLRHAMTATAGASLLAYALYCATGSAIPPGRALLSLPFAAFGVLEILRAAIVEAREVTPGLLVSPRLLLAEAGWLAAVLWGLAAAPTRAALG